MEGKMIEGKCCYCGKPLQIPAELEEFSCLYCGKKMRMRQFHRPVVPAADAEVLMQELPSQLAACIVGHRELLRSLNKKDFTPAFEAYAATCAPAFASLQPLCDAGGQTAMEMLAAALLDALDIAWQKEKRRTLREEMLQQDKMVVAVFFVPAMRRLSDPAGEIFATALQEQWVKRFPKNPFYLGTYDEIANGFRWKICFITTAICQAEGKPDDCPELTALRSFRDGWLSSTKEGRTLIEQYYQIAPGIVSCMQLGDNLDACCAMLRETYLEPCLADLETGNYTGCRQRYETMVHMLEKRYGLQ